MTCENSLRLLGVVSIVRGLASGSEGISPLAKGGNMARARTRTTLLAVAVALVVAAAPLLSIDAAPPGSATTTSVQLRITTPAGQPASGALSLTFRVFPTATGGSALWTEVHDGTARPKVTAVNGIISVVLGEGTPLDPSILDPAANRWLGVELAGQEVARVKLTASGYAVAAAAASGLWDPLSASVLDLVALDGRYVRATGGGGVVRTIAGVSPDAAGNFGLAAGPSGRVTLTPTTLGLQVETAQPVESLNGAKGAVSIAAGSNVSVSTNGNTITVNAQAGGLTQAEADGRYLFRNVNDGNGQTGYSLGAVQLTYDLGTPYIHSINGGHLQISTNAGGNRGQIIVDCSLVSFAGPAPDVLGVGTLRAQRLEAAEKFFVVPHPNDATKEIVYAALEGPECAMFVRGSAALVNGTVTISLPEHFVALAKADSVTVSLTPTADCRGLWVASKATNQVVVRESAGGTSNSTFDYVVFARRCNHAIQPVRDKQ